MKRLTIVFALLLALPLGSGYFQMVQANSGSIA